MHIDYKIPRWKHFHKHAIMALLHAEISKATSWNGMSTEQNYKSNAVGQRSLHPIWSWHHWQSKFDALNASRTNFSHPSLKRTWKMQTNLHKMYISSSAASMFLLASSKGWLKCPPTPLEPNLTLWSYFNCMSPIVKVSCIPTIMTASNSSCHFQFCTSCAVSLSTILLCFSFSSAPLGGDVTKCFRAS